MAAIKFFRETVLPSNLQTNSIYVISESGNATHAELYIIGNTETDIRRLYNKNDIENIVNGKLSQFSSIKVVENITERDALDTGTSVYVYVKDASDDSTVASGGATYIYDTGSSEWVKQSEAESMDVVTSWASIQGKPNSSVAQIDDAVNKRHNHTNMTQLNKIGEDVSGNLTYGGKVVTTQWKSTTW